jgi:hypothetical protein
MNYKGEVKMELCSHSDDMNNLSFANDLLDYMISNPNEEKLSQMYCDVMHRMDIAMLSVNYRILNKDVIKDEMLENIQMCIDKMKLLFST